VKAEAVVLTSTVVECIEECEKGADGEDIIKLVKVRHVGEYSRTIVELIENNNEYKMMSRSEESEGHVIYVMVMSMLERFLLPERQTVELYQPEPYLGFFTVFRRDSTVWSILSS